MSPALGSSGWCCCAMLLIRKLSCCESLFMASSESRTFKQLFGFFPCAKNDHTHGSLPYADDGTDFAMTELLHVGQPENGAFLRVEPIEYRGHIDRQIELLAAFLGRLLQL